MTLLSLSAEKDAARRSAKARRGEAAMAAPDAAREAMAVFLAAVPVDRAEVVAGYRPIRDELDPTPLMIALHERGVSLCVPVVMGAGRPLSFQTWTPETRMEAGSFGAQVPVDAREATPTLLVVPMLAFDRALWRLGYGGGFYDRTLEGLRARGGARAYGYAYAEQETDAVPIEPTDQRLDGVITPAGMIGPGR